MSFFSHVRNIIHMESIALKQTYEDDNYQKKVNLFTLTYLADDGKSWVLPIVKTVEKVLAYDDSLNKESLPVLGMDSCSRAATCILLGIDSPAIIQNRYIGVQCLSGTGAIRMGAEFLVKVMGKTVIYQSKPSWENQRNLYLLAGFKDIREYRYWNYATRELDFEGLMEDLENALPNSVVILQVCAHNPTGADPTPEQWEKIATTMKRRKLFPFFDSSSQGFASGDISKDAYSVRRFVILGLELFCAQSFSLCFGLYSDCVGNLTIVVNHISVIPKIKSQMILLMTAMNFTPPNHGARIVAYILNNYDMCTQWQKNIKTMSSRIISIRKQLREALEHLETPGSWSHLTQQFGMYSYTGLTEIQCENMIMKHHIYMMHTGEISFAGLNNNNVYYVAKAICESVKVFP